MAVQILVPVSGGKDSQACFKLALSHYPREVIRGLFCDTGFEHPLTYAHIETMRSMYGVRIDVIKAGTVEQQCLKARRFPTDVARFCTDELKIQPTKKYCKALAEEQGSIIQNKKRKIESDKSGGFEIWYGMRSDESDARAKRYVGKVGEDIYPPHEVLKKYPKYLDKLGVSFRLAVIDWTRADVMDYLNGEENPIYRILDNNGKPKFDRVGCFPCLAGGDKAKETAFEHDEFGKSQHQKVIRISAEIGKSVWKRDNRGNGCAVCSM